MRNISFAQDDDVPPHSPHQLNYNSYNVGGQSYGHFAHAPPNQPVYSPMPPSFQRYPTQQAFYEAPRQDFQLDTMHGMPGYPFQPPIPRSSQSTSPSAYSTAPHPSTTPRPYGWGSPPMSPAVASVPFGGMGTMAGLGRGDHERGMGKAMGPEEYGVNHSMMYGNAQPRGQWVTPPPSSPYAHYAPFQPQMELGPPIPALPPHHFQHRGSWTAPQQRPIYQNSPNRMARTGPVTGESQKERERKAYHPQPPARRSDWVMWVGNV